LSAAFRPKRRFKFESFWLNLEGFEEALREAWVCDPCIIDPFKRLDALFRNAAEYFQAWGEKRVGNIKLKIAMANTLILRFDVAQESRALSPTEAWLRKVLKLVVLGLASLERTIARQRSRLRWLREGDANTKLFHAVANGRRTKNYIAAVRLGDEMSTTQERKNEVFTEAFERLIGSMQTREHTVDLEALNIPVTDLRELDAMFTEEEVWNTIREMPSDRAPGPDGFTGAFYQRAWPIIKGDILAGLMKLGVGDGRGFARLNRALITLIPKKPEALEIKDFRPISLVHSFAKLFSKIIANRLRPRLGELVSMNQSAFIKHRSLHDNFMLVRQVARKINMRSTGVLLKLDIARAFDSISWSFLFEVLRRMGFGERYLKWVALLLYTANTRVVSAGRPHIPWQGFEARRSYLSHAFCGSDGGLDHDGH
jgi:hypothetical protein